uniref:Uncharacterized protein n=1 Tax=Glossina brevipalpis TaxID=37001 RepID=A0A1A9WQG6_9MUSC
MEMLHSSVQSRFSAFKVSEEVERSDYIEFQCFLLTLHDPDRVSESLVHDNAIIPKIFSTTCYFRMFLNCSLVGIVLKLLITVVVSASLVSETDVVSSSAVVVVVVKVGTAAVTDNPSNVI